MLSPSLPLGSISGLWGNRLLQGHIPLPPLCMCSMGFHPHIPGSCPCLRFCPHQSRVLSPPKVSSSPSMVHDHTFAAAWRVVGGCCFYEGKGPLVRSWGEC